MDRIRIQHWQQSEALIERTSRTLAQLRDLGARKGIDPADATPEVRKALAGLKEELARWEAELNEGEQ